MTSNKIKCTTVCNNFEPLPLRLSSRDTAILILSRIITGRNQEVCQLCELVFSEDCLVLTPVVLVGPLEALIGENKIENNPGFCSHLEGLFDGGRDRLFVMEEATKEDQQFRQQPK